MGAKRCCAYGCKSKSGPGHKFYKFPACKQRSREWLKALDRLDILADVNKYNKHQLVEFYDICDAHFTKYDKDNPDLVPVLHVASKGTCTEQSTDVSEDKSTSTADLIRTRFVSKGTCTKMIASEEKGTSTTDFFMNKLVSKGTCTKRIVSKDKRTSTADYFTKKLSITPIDIIDIPPLPSVVIPAYYIPTESNVDTDTPTVESLCQPIVSPEIPLVVPTLTPSRGYITAAVDNLIKSTNTEPQIPSITKNLRSYRKIMPKIAVKKLQTDPKDKIVTSPGSNERARGCNIPGIRVIPVEKLQCDNTMDILEGERTIETREYTSVCNEPEIKIETPEIKIETSEIKTETPEIAVESVETSEIKTEEHLALDDIYMALSERERMQPLESSVDGLRGHNITFKLKMNLPDFSMDQVTTSATSLKRGPELDDVDKNVRNYKNKRKDE